MEEEKSVDIHGMFETVMEKLSKLDSIEIRMKSLEQELKDVKDSITFVILYFLIFYNIKESHGEDTTEIIKDIMENTLGIENAKSIKIDRSHRIGKNKAQTTTKQRPIVAKFNYFPDKERVLTNARKFKGSGMAVSEQFPEEIAKERKRLYPEMKKAKEQGKRVKLVRDKLYIDGHLYRG